MPLDPNIILGAKPAQFDLAQFSPMNAMTSAMKFKQADQESQLNALKMQEYERSRTEEQDFRNYLATTEDPTNPAARQNLLRYGKTGAAYSEALGKQETEKLAQRKTALDIRTAQGNFLDKLRRELSSNPSDANVIAFGEDAAIQGLYTPAQVKSTVAQLLAMPPKDRVAVLAQSGATASELKPTLTPQTLGGTTQMLSTPAFGGAASVVPGSSQTVTMTPAQEREARDSAIRIRQEGQRIGLEGRRVSVLEEEAKQRKDPVFQQAMAGAKATGEAIAKGDVEAQRALPKIVSQADEAVRLIDQMVGKQEVKDASGKVIQKATAPHPGFQDVVGATWKPGARFVPGTNAADFQTFQDQIEGTAFLSAFESLKGGGAISEKEGEKATAARMRMKTASSEKAYMDAAREFQEVVRKGVEIARRRVPAAGGGTAAPAGAGGVKFLGFE